MHSANTVEILVMALCYSFQIQALSMRLDTAVADVLAKNALVEQYKAMLEEAKANENDYKKYQQYEVSFEVFLQGLMHVYMLKIIITL